MALLLDTVRRCCRTQHPLLPSEYQHLVSMQNFVGMLEYVTAWRWRKEAGTIKTTNGFAFSISALPILVDADGQKAELGKYAAGELVFASDAQAFSYMLSLAKRDLQYVGVFKREAGRR